VGERLAAHGRVYAVEFAGHGRTRSRARSAKVGANRRLIWPLSRVSRSGAGGAPWELHGGYLSLAQAAAEPEKVASLVLVDPAVPIVHGAGFDCGCAFSQVWPCRSSAGR